MKLLVSLLAASTQAAARDPVTCDAGYEQQTVGNETVCADINECENGRCLGHGSEKKSRRFRETLEK